MTAVFASTDAAPVALVEGEPVVELPNDLFIPPDALEVVLERFEGPLDLLLYLIRRNNLDIKQIDLTAITAQYTDYIELMQVLRLELAAEYLVMAATLAEIKSRTLLPRRASEEDEADDPRAELIRRLQEYERFKNAADRLDEFAIDGRDRFPAKVELTEMPRQKEQAIPLLTLVAAIKDVIDRQQLTTSHSIQREEYSTRERMSQILASLEQYNSDAPINFHSLLFATEQRSGVVVSFLAVLELVKMRLANISQLALREDLRIERIGKSVTATKPDATVIEMAGA